MLLFLVVMIAYAYFSYSMAKTTKGAYAMFFALIGTTAVAFLIGGAFGLPLMSIVFIVIYLFRNSDTYKQNSKGYVAKEGEKNRSLAGNLMYLTVSTVAVLAIAFIILLWFMHLNHVF